MGVIIADYAGNAHRVSVKPLDFDAEGSPTTKTFHGVTIVVNSRVVGRVSSWNPQMYNRPGQWVYELSYHTFGRPVDYVPGRNEGYTATLARTEVWNQEIEVAMGFGAVFNDLCDQDRPWITDEYLFRGSSGQNQLYRWWQCTGCWFSNRNEDAFSSEGETMIRVSAEVAFVSRRNMGPTS